MTVDGLGSVDADDRGAVGARGGSAAAGAGAGDDDDDDDDDDDGVVFVGAKTAEEIFEEKKKHAIVIDDDDDDDDEDDGDGDCESTGLQLALLAKRDGAAAAAVEAVLKVKTVHRQRRGVVNDGAAYAAGRASAERLPVAQHVSGGSH
jgi:hypothetical protein